MNLTTVTLGQLVDRALEGVQAAPEVGRLVVRTDPLGSGDTGLTLNDASIVSVTDSIEFADELVFVTAKSDDSAGANISVIRGHGSTTPRSHPANQVGTLNPRWSRHRVASLIDESLADIESHDVYIVRTDPMVVPYVDPYDNFATLLPVPEGARRVITVRAGTHQIANWNDIAELPEGDYPDSRVIRLPRHLRTFDGPYSITYQAPFRWSTDPVTEASTVEMPEGGKFLPSLYAVSRLVSDREVSRSQVDRSEEWTAGEHDTGPALVRLKQQEYQVAVDAVRRAIAAAKLPRRRPFVSEPEFTGMGWRTNYS